MTQGGRTRTILSRAVSIALMLYVALATAGSAQEAAGDTASEPEYAARIFGEDIISIGIFADEADWQWMLDNAINEEYISVDVAVNGTTYRNVGIRPKGNSSLSKVASSGSDRFSFRLQFDEYTKGQTCFGLDSFVINNMTGDSTYMKEYVSYELMREIGVEAPYFGFADIKVNGKAWGLYLAVERYSKSYEKRAFGDTSGMLYNVKTMDINGDDAGGLGAALPGNKPAMPDWQSIPAMQQNPQANAGAQPFAPPSGSNWPSFNLPANADMAAFPMQTRSETGGMDRGFGGVGGRGGSGGSLQYTDDNTGSYAAIFGNVVGKGEEDDYKRVVEALKALSEGRELEKYFDVDQILRYLAAHTIVVNLDSYSSSMAQNYFIYEREGRITILPWDYNLAWGGFQSGDASSVVNFPIDTPISGVDIASRPLIEKLFANAEYLQRYHNYLQQLIDCYFADGKFQDKVSALDALISGYVEDDPTAFCTYEQYKAAILAFIKLGDLRAQSIQGQLDGTVPATTAAQNESPDKLISPGSLKLSDLGNMMGGRGANPGGFTDFKMPRQDD